MLTLLLVALALYFLIKTYINKRLEALEKKHHEQQEKERINKELNLTSRIQQNMLSHIFPPFPERKEFEIYASMTPAKVVGGDFYDFFMIDNDHLCLIMADVSGKGIPGALFMMMSKIILQSYAKSIYSPAEILKYANNTICANNPENMFVTVWLGILEISTGVLRAANAGHELPAVKYKDGKFELLQDKHGFVLGGMEDSIYQENELHLNKGSKIFLYTDGVPEASDSENNMFTTDRMIDVLNIDLMANTETTINNVIEAVNDFVSDAEQFDDLTTLCLEYKGNIIKP